MVEIGIIIKIIVQLLIGKTLTELGTILMEVVSMSTNWEKVMVHGIISIRMVPCVLLAKSERSLVLYG